MSRPEGHAPLWTWPELCRALGIEERPGPDVQGISIDSRRVQPGELFVALTGDPGPRFNPSHRSDRDGHDFVADALQRGAAGVLVHDQVARSAPQLQVADTLDGLWALGAAARARLRGPVVAVTGSSGKTTAKALLAAALKAFATSGSLNNHLGVPLSLALTPRNAAAAVYEIGTNHPGEIGPLAQLVRPDVAAVLNVHPAHRENFASMDELLTEKLSIHQGLGSSGHLVLEESLNAAALPEGIAVSRFGRGPGCRVRLLKLTEAAATFQVGEHTLSAHVPGGGEHRALSLAAVLTVLAVLERPMEDGCRLPDTLIPPGRGRVSEAGGVTLIDDSYNANPESMKAALQGLVRRSERRRFALLGEMLELGPDGAAFHRGLADLAGRLDGVFCVGEGMRALADVLPAGRCLGWQARADEALIERLAALLEPGDALLVKGSNRVFWAGDFLTRVRRALTSEEK